MVVTEPVKGTKQINNIWVYDLRDREVRKFTTSKKSDRHPRWSPDGRNLAFLSNREGTSQIYALSMSGGEAQAVTKSKTGVRGFKWSPDGTKIAFLSADPKTEEEEKKIKAKEQQDLAVSEASLKTKRELASLTETLVTEKETLKEIYATVKDLVKKTNRKPTLGKGSLYIVDHGGDTC